MKKRIQTTRKRLLSVLLAVAMVLTALPLTALSAFATTVSEMLQNEKPLFATDKTSQEIPMTVSASSADDFTYVSIDMSIRITGYTGTATDVIIPDTINGREVIEIGQGAFQNKEITSVTIPKYVNRIGENAFSGCTSLKRVLCLESNCSYFCIEANVFSGCTGLEYFEITARQLWRSDIADSAFVGCTTIDTARAASNLKPLCFISGDLTTHDEIKEFAKANGFLFIGEPGALKDGDIWYTISWDNCATVVGYTGIDKNIVIPETLGEYTVDEIQSDALYCTDAVSITVPGTLRFGNATGGCTTVQNLFVGTESSSLYSEDGVLFKSSYNYDYHDIEKALYAYPVGRATDTYVVPTDTVHILDGAFSGAEKLVSITLPEGLKSIGTNAFSNCVALQNIHIPSSVTEIGRNILANTPIETNNLKNGVLYFDDCLLYVQPDSAACNTAFTVKDGTRVIAAGSASNIGLTTLSLPNSVRYIGEDAFYHNELTTVTIPEGVLRIDDYAFAFNFALTEVTLPASLQTIGAYVFFGVPDGGWTGTMKLKKITFLGAATEINYRTFGYDNTCLSEAIIYGYTGSSAEIFANENGIPFESLGNAPLTFAYRVQEDGTAEITDIYGAIGDVIIPETIDGYTVTAIVAFSSCIGMRSLFIPSSVNYINNYYNLSHCEALETITVADGNTEYTARDGVLFSKNMEHLLVYPLAKPDTAYRIPSGVKYVSGIYNVNLKTLHFSDTVYSFYGHLSALESFTVDKNNPYYTAIDGVLFSKSERLMLEEYPAQKTDTAYTVPSGVIDIGNSAFNGNPYLSSVTLPEGVKHIYYDAFRNCSALSTVYLPDSLEYVAVDAFENTAYSNNETNWENGILYIGNQNKQWILETHTEEIPAVLTFRDGTQKIPSGAFSNCTSLTSVTIPNNVTSIGDYAFEDCTSLASISLPNSLREVGQNAFNNTAYFNNDSNWENGVLYIDKVLYKAKPDAVLGDYTVKDGTIGIASLAFAEEASWDYHPGNPTLTSVTMPDGIKFIGQGAFVNCTALRNIIIPDSVENIYANPQWDMSDYIFAFQGTAYSKDISNWTEDGCLYIGNHLVSFRPQDEQTTLCVREGTITISEFLLCLTIQMTDVVLPRSVQHIGESNIPYVWGSLDDNDDIFIGKVYGYAGTVTENYYAQYPNMCKFMDITPKISLPDGETGTIEVSYNQMTVETLVGELQYQDSTIQSIAVTDEAGNEVTDMNTVCSTGMTFTVTYTSGNTAVFTVQAAQTVTPGDVNGDNKINAVDARFVLQAASGARVLDDTQKAAADVNGDGKINAVDARWILQVASGVRTL